jgi:molecular chaperone DnaK (HSP70)
MTGGCVWGGGSMTDIIRAQTTAHTAYIKTMATQASKQAVMKQRVLQPKSDSPHPCHMPHAIEHHAGCPCPP